jgi:hypothetical protein
MVTIFRGVVALVGGLLAAAVLIFGSSEALNSVYPLPPEVDPTDTESLRAYLDRPPLGALLLVSMGWVGGTFAGSWVAARVAGRARLAHGLILGALLLAACGVGMMRMPYPWWLWVLRLGVIPPAAFLGAKLAAIGLEKRPRNPPPSVPERG